MLAADGRDIKERLTSPISWWFRPTSAAWCAPRPLKRINAPLAIIDKRRERAGESEVMNVIGDCAGYTYS